MCDAFPALLLDLAVCTVAQRYHLCQRRQELTAIFEARVHAAVRGGYRALPGRAHRSALPRNASY